MTWGKDKKLREEGFVPICMAHSSIHLSDLEITPEETIQRYQCGGWIYEKRIKNEETITDTSTD